MKQSDGREKCFQTSFSKKAEKETTYSQMKRQLKFFTSEQLFDLHGDRRAHQSPDVIHRSHIDLLLAANSAQGGMVA